ncbi:MAG: MFS transporter [Firmicutes bacterium]|nr:MFS transporter [Bacillota bacterium]
MERPRLSPYVGGLLNFLIYAASFSSLIFVPVLCRDLGASPWGIGVIGAVYGAAYWISSLYFGWRSDVSGRVGFIRLGIICGTVAFTGQLFAGDLVSLAVWRGLVGLALGMTTAALVALAYETGIPMGTFSSYGSLGWVAGAAAGAVLQDYRRLFLLSAFLGGLALILSAGLREAAPASRRPPPRPGEVMKRQARVYAAVFLRHLGAGGVWVLLPLYFAELGASAAWIGVLWALNFAGQVPGMRLAGRFDAARAFRFGLIGSSAVFAGYALARDYTQLIPAQALLAAAWSGLYVGALLLVLRAGEERGTAGGGLVAILNLCEAVGPLWGGAVAEVWGYRTVMGAAAALCLAGYLAYVVPRPVFRGRSASAGGAGQERVTGGKPPAGRPGREPALAAKSLRPRSKGGGGE